MLRHAYRGKKGNNMLVAALLAAALVTASASGGEDVYRRHCATCHHPQRLGHTAPPLIPETLGKTDAAALAGTIRNGLPATAMPSFKNMLREEDIAAVAGYLLTPAATTGWSMEDIVKSRKTFSLPSAAKLKADPSNIILVVERGTGKIVLLDGDTLTKVGEFLAGAVHGGPKFTGSFDSVFSLARDGIMVRYDTRRLARAAWAKVAVSSRGAAVTPDGNVAAVMNLLPQELLFLDGTLAPLKKIPLAHRPGGLYWHAGKKAFICSFRDAPELWIIDPVTFAVETVPLPVPFEDFALLRNLVFGSKRGVPGIHVFDLDRRETIATLPADGMPHLASAAFYKEDGGLFVAVNFIDKPLVSIYRLDTYAKVGDVPLPSPGYFIRTHRNTPYLWIDTAGDTLVLAEKRNLGNTRTLTPSPGKRAMHVEFTKEGRAALVSVTETDGEVAVYDAGSLQKTGRLPFNKPMGKYNAMLKTHPDAALEDAQPQGKNVFQKYCMGCHHETIVAFGPPFAEIAARRSEEEIRLHIAMPKESAAAHNYKINSMPVIPLTAREMDDIVAYIASFKGK